MMKSNTVSNAIRLHSYVLNNKNGIHNDKIEKLIQSNVNCLEITDSYGRTALQSIIDAFLKIPEDQKQENLNTFKPSAMILAKAGADITLKATGNSSATLLHVLATYNESGVNNNDIATLVKLNSDCIKIKDYYRRPALQSTIDAFVDKKCSLNSLKQSAMCLIAAGADFTVEEGRYHSCGGTLLTVLTCYNENGVNDDAINQLLALSNNDAEKKRVLIETALQSIIQALLKKQCSFDSFKRSAMLFARAGLAITPESNFKLLHSLALHNESNSNNADITELATLNPNCLNIRNYNKLTVLQSLIDGFIDQKCSLDNFRQSAMHLVSLGADFTTEGRTCFFNGNTLLSVLARYNKEGVNNEAIKQLLTLNLNADALKKTVAAETALRSLINDFDKKNCDFDSFKPSAMLFISLGLDATLDTTAWLCHRLIKILAFHNDNGVNDKDIETLIKLDVDFLKSKDNREPTVLQSLINAFIDKKCSLNSFEHSAMFFARAGADILVQSDANEQALTILHIIAKNNTSGLSHSLIAELIMSNPNILDIKNSENKTALELMPELDVNDINSGLRLIDYAVIYSSKPLIKWLIDNKKIDLDATNALGETPLHLAVKRKNMEIIELLHHAGADHNVKNNDGVSPLDLAWRIDHNIFAYLSPKDELFKCVGAMRNYGLTLVKDENSAKGQVAIDLANKLNNKATEFFEQALAQQDFSTFKAEFLLLLHSKDPDMSAYRFSWKTVAANVAIALTGIGLIPIAGKIVYSLATQKRPLFFFQQDKTTCEQKIADLQQSFNCFDQTA